MYQIIATVAIVLVATLTTLSNANKCDIMKEFKPEVDDISGWAKARCDANPELTEADLKLASDCYGQHMQEHFQGADCAKAIDKFVKEKIFEHPDTKKVCKDKPTQDNIKKGAMKDIGMKKGMECKKIMEANCPPYKEALQKYTKCVQA